MGSLHVGTMKRILVTGFEPFGGHVLNPSAQIVEALALDPVWRHQVDTLIVPVSYSSADSIVKNKISQKSYDYVLMLGQASGRSKISLERVALNWIESDLADSSGEVLSGQKINPAAENAIFASLPLEKLKLELQAIEIPVEISLNAGGYVCNYLFFQVAQAIADTSTKCGFIHLPLLPEQVSSVESASSLAFDIQFKAVLSLLSYLRQG